MTISPPVRVLFEDNGWLQTARFAANVGSIAVVATK